MKEECQYHYNHFTDRSRFVTVRNAFEESSELNKNCSSFGNFAFIFRKLFQEKKRLNHHQREGWAPSASANKLHFVFISETSKMRNFQGATRGRSHWDATYYPSSDQCATSKHQQNTFEAEKLPKVKIKVFECLPADVVQRAAHSRRPDFQRFNELESREEDGCGNNFSRHY